MVATTSSALCWMYLL